MRRRRRLLLLALPLPFIALIPFNGVEYVRDFRVHTPLIMLAIYSVLLNFPSIVKSYYGKPVYYEDLEDDRYVNVAYRKKFQAVFITIGQLCLSFMFASLIYYYIHKYHINRFNVLELCGIIGGFMSFISRIFSGIKFVLKTCYYIKKNTSTTLNSSKKYKILFKMSDIDIGSTHDQNQDIIDLEGVEAVK